MSPLTMAQIQPHPFDLRLERVAYRCARILFDRAQSLRSPNAYTDIHHALPVPLDGRCCAGKRVVMLRAAAGTAGLPQAWTAAAQCEIIDWRVESADRGSSRRGEAF